MIDDITASVIRFGGLQEIAHRISADHFKSGKLTQIGTEAWHVFVTSAKTLATIEQQHRTSGQYPEVDDQCLLCQQPLTSEARELILRLWTFLENEAQANVERSQMELEAKRAWLPTIELDFFNDQTVSYRHLQEQDSVLLQNVITFFEIALQRRSDAMKMIDSRQANQVAKPPPSVIYGVQTIMEALNVRLKDLVQKNTIQEIADREREYLLLQHRTTLALHMPQIEEFLRRRVWAQKAARVGGNTRHITQMHNELFKQLVTDRYIQVFEQTLADLQRPLKVKVQTKGRKGETLKQIVLQSDSSMSMDRLSPDKVLSEGEKRAVALADFLTEVAIDESSCSIILDDPVTSLDFEWKAKIAERLVKEAQHRQVVAFTHDLHFLYLLQNQARDSKVEIRTHWIKRGDLDDKPGYVFIDNGPAMEQEYRDATRARRYYEKARSAQPEEQEVLLKAGFGALRTTYEAFVIFELLERVVQRFEERVIFGNLSKIVWDKSIVEEANAKFELLSRYLEGHLHSDVFVAQKPTPQMLIREIENYDQLKKRLRALKKP